MSAWAYVGWIALGYGVGLVTLVAVVWLAHVARFLWLTRVPR